MKKTLLIALTFYAGFAANAQVIQASKKVNPFHKDLTHTALASDALSINDKATPFKAKCITGVPGFDATMKTTLNVTEAEIGETTYDLQTNRSMGRRISNVGNGTLSAVWTMSAVATPFSDRGTGYNYFDGTAWQAFPTARIEYKRCGFTNIFVDGGNEYVLSHTGDSGLIMDKRTTQSGPWSFTHPVGTYNLFSGQADVWSRLGVSGNYIHAIVNSQGTGTAPVLGQNGPLTYTRSNDGGATWGIDHVVNPLIDATQYYGFSAESYSMDVRGATVAIVGGGFTNDVVLLKSTDNGDTWTKTIIKPFPIPLYDPLTMISDVDGDAIADTIETNAGDVTVSIDNNGMCHVAFGYMLTLDDDPATNVSYFPSVTGMYYWNESMGANNPSFFEPTIDYNNDGVLNLPDGSVSGVAYGLYNTGLTCQPSIGFDASNNVYMAFSNADESADTTIFHEIHRHVYVIRSTDGGVTWSWPYNIVPNLAQGGDGEFQEGVYASIAREVDASVHVVYQRDVAAGHSLSNNTTQAGNNAAEASKIVYAKFDVAVLGVNEQNGAASQSVNLYPNPVGDIAHFNAQLKNAGTVEIKIYSIVGTLLQTSTYKNVNSGNQTLEVNVSQLAAGTYTYNLKNDAGFATGTFVKK